MMRYFLSIGSEVTLLCDSHGNNGGGNGGTGLKDKVHTLVASWVMAEQ